MATTNTTSVPSNGSQASGNASSDTPGVYDVWEVVVIILITGPLSMVTIIGNLLVMISFRVNSHLRTVNNFFLLSLAVADLILGMVSMNLYTTYIIMGHWTLGNLACDIWLAIDYVASNASVMNLLIISFDRFFSVTRPLTYRVKRTPRRAAIMISLAWAISLVLWAPAILFWQYVEGKRTVPKDECHIQFLKEPIITFGTAIAAFYLPVTIMIILYWRVYRETENRARGLTGLLGSPGGNAEATRTSGHRAMATSVVGSTSSSSGSGSSAGTPAEELAPTRTGRPSCLPLLRELPHTGRSFLEASSSGRWTVDDEGPSSTSEGESEREAGGLSGAPVRVPLIAVSKDLGEIPEGHDQSCRVPRRRDSGANPTSSQITQQVSTKPPAPVPPKAKKSQNTSLIREKKAARTLSAILLAFILTWTPYNIMVLVSTFCEHCVPEKLWHLGYWLCYVNSTINPMCYALCNESFRVTFKMLLLCRWDKRKWGRPHSKPLPYAPPQKFSSVV